MGLTRRLHSGSHTPARPLKCHLQRPKVWCPDVLHISPRFARWGRGGGGAVCCPANAVYEGTFGFVCACELAR